MYDVAALASGYTVEDPAAFAARVNALMGGGAAEAAPGPADAEGVAAEVVPEEGE